MRTIILARMLLLGVVSMCSPGVSLARQALAVGDPAVVSDPAGHGVRARSGPGVSYRVLGILKDGTIVEIVAGPVSDGGDDWYQLAVGGVVAGWGLARHLQPTVPSVPGRLERPEGASRPDTLAMPTRSHPLAGSAYTMARPSTDGT